MGTLCGALVCRSRPRLELIGKTKPQFKAIKRDRMAQFKFERSARQEAEGSFISQEHPSYALIHSNSKSKFQICLWSKKVLLVFDINQLPFAPRYSKVHERKNLDFLWGPCRAPSSALCVQSKLDMCKYLYAYIVDFLDTS